MVRHDALLVDAEIVNLAGKCIRNGSKVNFSFIILMKIYIILKTQLEEHKRHEPIQAPVPEMQPAANFEEPALKQEIPLLVPTPAQLAFIDQENERIKLQTSQQRIRNSLAQLEKAQQLGWEKEFIQIIKTELHNQ